MHFFCGHCSWAQRIGGSRPMWRAIAGRGITGNQEARHAQPGCMSEMRSPVHLVGNLLSAGREVART